MADATGGDDRKQTLPTSSAKSNPPPKTSNEESDCAEDSGTTVHEVAVNQVKGIVDYDYEDEVGAHVLVVSGNASVHYHNVYNLLRQDYIIFELLQQ